MESADGLRQLLRESEIALGSEIAHQLLSYLALLEKWNSRVNLTAATEWSALEPLFREGIWASKKYPSEAINHLDVGSGAGFPAILLRILVPRIHLEMVESRAKKSTFLETVVHSLGMNGVRVYPERLDAFLRDIARNKAWDCISWKGVRLNTNDLLQLCTHMHSRTHIWIFHGKEIAVEEPEVFGKNFRLYRNEKVPGRRESHLSIFLSRR